MIIVRSFEPVKNLNNGCSLGNNLPDLLFVAIFYSLIKSSNVKLDKKSSILFCSLHKKGNRRHTSFPLEHSSSVLHLKTFALSFSTDFNI
jgi:hypothetical protein